MTISNGSLADADDILNYFTFNGNQQLQQDINILINSAASASTLFPYDDMFLDIFTDANGFDNTVDLGNTDAIFNAGADDYSQDHSVLSDSLVAYYPLQTDATDSEGSNNGTVIGATFVTGKVGDAASFDGVNDEITIPDATDLDFGTGDFSINCWIKTTDDQNIISKIRSSAPFTGFSFGIGNAGKIDVRIDGTGSGQSIGATAVNDNTFHMLTMVRDGNIVRVYVDAVADGTFDYGTSTDVDNSELMRFMKLPFGTFMSGVLDEVGIWKGRAITPAEITSLYNSGSGITYATLITTEDTIGIVQTIAQAITANPIAHQLISHNTLVATGTLDYDVSFDGGVTFETSQALNTRNTDVHAGGSMILKLNLNTPITGDSVNLTDYAIMLFY